MKNKSKFLRKLLTTASALAIIAGSASSACGATTIATTGNVVRHLYAHQKYAEICEFPVFARVDPDTKIVISAEAVFRVAEIVNKVFDSKSTGNASSALN